MTNNHKTDVSVIIVNYNTCQITANCIDSVFDKTEGISFEVIVVDNASTDGSKERFEKDKRIKYIFSEKNGGFGYGNNLGMELAKGKYFFLLNSDTLLVNNAIKEFYNYAESHEHKTVYGCWLVGDDGTYRHSFFFFPAYTINQYIHRKIHGQDYSPTWDNREVECITGADMFFPRTAYEECGGFDENIFLYGEEGELQYRMMLQGYKRMLINTPKIIHLEGKSLPTAKRKAMSFMASHYYILHKWMNTPTYILARIYYYILLKIKK